MKKKECVEKIKFLSHGCRLKCVVGFFVILIGIPLFFSCSRNEIVQPRALGGVIDVRTWDFNKNGVITLDGEWEFYRDKLLSPEDFMNSIVISKPYYINVPDLWSEYKKDSKPIGYATYRLNVKIDETDTVFGIKTLPVLSAYNLFINDKKIISCGQVGLSLETTIPKYCAETVYFSINPGKIEIIIQVSNFHHFAGGICYPLLFGPAANIAKIKRDKETYDNIFLGIILMFGFYHISLFIIRKNDKSPLILGILCFIVGVVILITGERSIAYFIPDIDFELQKKIEYIIPFFAMFFLVKYISIQFPGKIPKKQFYFEIILSIPFILFITFTPLRIYGNFIIVYIILFGLFLCYLLIVLIKILLIKRNGPSLLLVSVFFIFMSLFIEILTANHILVIKNSEIFVALGIIIALFIESFSLARKFAMAYRTAENLSDELKKYSMTLEQKVLERTKQISEVNDQKTNFFINIAHETKTPLTLISNYLTQYLKKIDKTEEILIIKQNIDKLLRDMMNFLDVEKLKRGQFLYHHKQVVNFSKTLKEGIQLFKEIAIIKKIKVTTSIDDNLFIEIDPAALDRIINNMIENAIRYTKRAGKIKLTLKHEGNWVVFTIADNGIGISEEQQENIFKPFYQVSNKKRNSQGIGMGLNIVRNIVKDIGGKIRIESVPDLGSIFSLFFPFYIVLENDLVVDGSENTIPGVSYIDLKLDEENYSQDKSTVFIIEDNIEMLHFLQSSMKGKYNVFYAMNGKQALMEIKWKPKPDIIISDIMMDEMDGFEFYDELSKLEEYNTIPFVFLTAKTGENNKLKGLLKGAVDYISKPFVINELMAKIESIIKNKILQQEASVKEFENKLSGLLRQKNTFDINKKFIEYKISDKEKKVIMLLQEGLEYKEIGCELNISLSGIKKRIHSIYQKCGVQNKSELFNLFRI